MRTGRGRRLTDEERETIQFVRGALNISQAARALRCDRRTVRYWQATENGSLVRPKGAFARGC